MRIKKIIKLFRRGNVCVFGLRGCGKDMLFGNVIARRKEHYISNLNYTHDENYIPFNPLDFDCGRNTYHDFIAGTIKPYIYPHPHGADLYISDVGIYFPSQFCNELNRDYKYFPTYFALSRQISQNNVHTNTQALNRQWDKLREQSDTYVLCNGCKVLFGKIVLMRVTLYDKYESALAKVAPFKLKLPWRRSKESKMMWELERERHRQTHGKIKSGLLLFWNKSKYDTLALGNLLKGEKNENLS